MRTTSRESLPQMLNTTRSLLMMLAVPCCALLSWLVAHLAALASWNHAFSEPLESGWVVQKSTSTFRAITCVSLHDSHLGVNYCGYHSHFGNCAHRRKPALRSTKAAILAQRPLSYYSSQIGDGEGGAPHEGTHLGQRAPAGTRGEGFVLQLSWNQ